MWNWIKSKVNCSKKQKKIVNLIHQLKKQLELKDNKKVNNLPDYFEELWIIRVNQQLRK